MYCVYALFSPIVQLLIKVYKKVCGCQWPREPEQKFFFAVFSLMLLFYQMLKNAPIFSRFVFICASTSREISLMCQHCLVLSDRNWIAHTLYLRAHSYDAMYLVQESKSKFVRALLPFQPFFPIFLALSLNTCLNEVWNYYYTVNILEWSGTCTFQVLKSL